MRRGVAVGVLSVVGLLGPACDAIYPDLRPKVIYLVPENFSGWVCVDFNIKGAPALPREGEAVVIRASRHPPRDLRLGRRSCSRISC